MSLHPSVCAPKCACCRLFQKTSPGHSGLERNGPEGEWAGSDRGGTGMDKEEGQNEVRRGGDWEGLARDDKWKGKGRRKVSR